jgi:hypothetical protein
MYVFDVICRTLEWNALLSILAAIHLMGRWSHSKEQMWPRILHGLHSQDRGRRGRNLIRRGLGLG